MLCHWVTIQRIFPSSNFHLIFFALLAQRMQILMASLIFYALYCFQFVLIINACWYNFCTLHFSLVLYYCIDKHWWQDHFSQNIVSSLIRIETTKQKENKNEKWKYRYRMKCFLCYLFYSFCSDNNKIYSSMDIIQIPNVIRRYEFIDKYILYSRKKNKLSMRSQ